MFRLLLLGIAAVIVKVAMPTFGVELTWPQAIVATILAQVFAFMFTGTQNVEMTLLTTRPKREDDEE